MKKILVILCIVVLAIGCFYFYQKYTTEQSINKTIENLSDEQRNKVKSDISDMISQTNESKKKASEMGLPTLPVNNQEIEKDVTDAAIKASDAEIKSQMQTYGIPASAELYFSQNQNYGISKTNNICENPDPSVFNFSSILSSINENSKTLAKCAISNQFPSKTFTVIVPSLVTNGLYCTDQNGFAGLITNDNTQFVSGVKCK
jgi:hypothetical protein